MDYLDGKITKEEFIRTRGVENTQRSCRNALRMLDKYTQSTYQKTGEQVVLEIANEISKDGKYDRLFRFTNNFVQWLQQDHNDITIKKRMHDEPLRRHAPKTIETIITYIKSFYEEVGQIEFSERKFKRMVKLPKHVKYEPYPLSRDEIKLILDRVMPKRKALYMIMKDTGLRIREAMLIKKGDFNFNSTPVSLNIPPNNDKTNSTNETRYITRETAGVVEAYASNKNDEEYLFFNRSVENIINICQNESVLFNRTRKQLGLTARYEHNNRHKITLHSFRAFCATTLADKYGEEFAHGYIGHSKYLGQYIRNKKKVPEKFLKIENELMIYHHVEVIDETEKVMGLQQDVKQLQSIMRQLMEQKDISTQLQLEIQKLKNLT